MKLINDRIRQISLVLPVLLFPRVITTRPLPSFAAVPAPLASSRLLYPPLPLLRIKHKKKQCQEEKVLFEHLSLPRGTKAKTRGNRGHHFLSFFGTENAPILIAMCGHSPSTQLWADSSSGVSDQQRVGSSLMPY